MDIKHAKRVLDTLRQFQTADVHSRNRYIFYIDCDLLLIERDGATEKNEERLNGAIRLAEEWLASQINMEADL